MTSKIDQSINAKVQAIIDEQNALIHERADVINGAWVARVAQEHLLMVGPGGTAKSFFVRNFTSHIEGAKFFETAFDETTDPSQVFGPPDIKAMVEDGKTRRVVTGMLPEATDAFLDEFFNGNGPLLHSVMPVLNERVFHNNGLPTAVPLRSCFMGTNKLNSDADQAALWDRVHLRYTVNYLSDRNKAADMVSAAIARMAIVGRGVDTSIAAQKTTVTLDELDQAHKEALDLLIPDGVFETFFDIRDELAGNGIHVSDRRVVEGMAAVLAQGWVRNHEEIKLADLDILANMWWTLQDEAPVAKGIILGSVNPGEKAALDLLTDLDALKTEIKQAQSSDIDESRKKRVGVETVKNADRLLREANEHLTKATAAGADTARIKEVIAKTDAFKMEIGRDIFGIDPQQMKSMQDA